MIRNPRMRVAAATAAWMLALAAPLAAGPHLPELSLGLGTTAAVQGTLDSGGFAAWGAALWPVDGPWSFGFAGFVDDMGNSLVQAIRPGAPPVRLGTVEQRHRFVYGGSWRLDARLPGAARWQPTASAMWSVARVQDDARGVVLDGQSTTGLGLGLGLSRPILQRSTVGAVLRYHHLFNDRVDGYMSGGLEWGWRFGKTP